MVEGTLPFQWSDKQWNQVLQVVQDEANKARVYAQFLPVVGPLSPDTTTVPAQRMSIGDGRLSVDDYDVLPLITLAVNVELSTAQVAQPDLSTPLTIFRRAANMIARAEDYIISRGKTENSPGVHGVEVKSAASAQKGLVDIGKLQAGTLRAPKTGEESVSSLIDGIGVLQKNGYVGPYALVLGNALFAIAYNPNGGSLVLPSDRMKPILDGPLLRSSVLEPENLILLSLGGDPVEIVVASDISVRFLQVTREPRYIFRVSERFVLRVKDEGAVLAL